MDSREGSVCSLTTSTATATVRDARKLFDDLRQAHKDNRQLKLRCAEDQKKIARLERQVEEERTNGSVVQGLRADLARAEEREAALQQQLAAAEEQVTTFKSLLADRDGNDETRDAEIDELHQRIAGLEEERKSDIIARDRLTKEGTDRQLRFGELEASLKLEKHHLTQWSAALGNFKRGLEKDALLRFDATPEEIPLMREKCNTTVDGMRQTLERQTASTRSSHVDTPPGASSPGNSGGTTPHATQAPPISARTRSMSVRHNDPNDMVLTLPESGTSLFAVMVLEPLGDLLMQIISIIEKSNDMTQRAIAPNTMKPKAVPGGTNASPSQDKSSAKALGFWAKR